MPNVPDSVRQSILQGLNKKKVRETSGEEKTTPTNNDDNFRFCPHCGARLSENSITPPKKDITEFVGTSNSSDTTSDLASALSKMNLFEETMDGQEKEEGEIAKLKDTYREKIKEKVINEKSLNIIRTLDL